MVTLAANYWTYVTALTTGVFADGRAARASGRRNSRYTPTGERRHFKVVGVFRHTKSSLAGGTLR
jgi:hypothetical protein